MNRELLIVINLRGGADALNMLVPHADPDYYRLRPTLAIDRPDGGADSAIDLDGQFGLHPALAPLMPHYRAGHIAFINAVGWPGDSHSHFQAWEEIESGVAGPVRPQNGWLARLLQLRAPRPSSPMRAVAFGELMPRLLVGALGVTTLRSLNDYRLANSALHNALAALYGRDRGALGTMALTTLSSITAVASAQVQTGLGAGYPDSDFGRQLAALERLISSGIALEAASLDLEGWDTHIMQGRATGHMARLLSELATGLATFMSNLRHDLNNTLIVVMSEFGRRVGENGSGGTDHGQGGLMMICGGRVHGGRVYGDWPGLAQLVGPGDLRITTDYRAVLSEIVKALLSSSAIAEIFPQYRPARQLGFI